MGARVHERWPDDETELTTLQVELARDASAVLRSASWTPGEEQLVGGCFVAFAHSVPGLESNASTGDGAWAAAIVWRPTTIPLNRRGEPFRKGDDALRGRREFPRQARDVEEQAVVSGRVSAPYMPGLLALRQGRLLTEAVSRLTMWPDVLLVDATGLDHPRRAGLATHLGAVLGLPTVGVTDRPLLSAGECPSPERGARSPVFLDGAIVGYWVTTRRGARPVLAHSAWRTTAETAADVVLITSTNSARTPIPLQEARRVAREARSRRC